MITALFFSFVITGFITIMLMVTSVLIFDSNYKLKNTINKSISIFMGTMVVLAFLIFILGCFSK